MRAITAEERARRLGEANLIPLILSMSAPAIAGNLSNALYNIISRMYLGRFVGRAAMGAMGVIFPLNNLFGTLSVMLTIGGAARVSLTLGGGDREKADRVATNILAIAAIASAVFAAGYFCFADELVALCGASPTDAVFEPAVQYLRISAFGMVFQLINQASACIIRAEGNTMYSMLVSVSGNVMNVVLGAVFIIWLGIGVRGAALATMLSQLFGMVFSLMYFVRKKSVVRWAGVRAVDIRTMLLVLGTGVAPGIFQGLSFFTNIFINNSIQQYAASLDGGFDLAVSATSVISSLEGVAITLIMGFNTGIASIISYCYGAKKYRRVMKTALVGQALASAATVVIWLLMMFAPGALFSIFVSGEDTAVLEYGAYAIHRSKMFMFFLGFQTLASMYYSAIGKPKRATVISVFRNGMFLIPALLLLPRTLGLDGVLYSTSVSDVCSAVAVAGVYIWGMAELKRKIRETEPPLGAAERIPAT